MTRRHQKPISIGDMMRIAPVIPVLVIDDPKDAKPIAEVLVEAGLKCLEVTLRTNAALEVIQEMVSVPGAIVGAGTVTSPQQLEKVMGAGAEFIVSPGLTETLGRAAGEMEIPFLPGIANASDILRGLELGLNHFKFFPAAQSGGIAGLKALAGPFADLKFCPTGGVSPVTAAQWLELEQVLCVGGTWIVPPGATDLSVIRQNASRAACLGC